MWALYYSYTVSHCQCWETSTDHQPLTFLNQPVAQYWPVGELPSYPTTIIDSDVFDRAWIQHKKRNGLLFFSIWQ